MPFSSAHKYLNSSHITIQTCFGILQECDEGLLCFSMALAPTHSSLIDYLAQVIYAKKMYFSIGMGSYDHHAKYQGVFP